MRHSSTGIPALVLIAGLSLAACSAPGSTGTAGSPAPTQSNVETSESLPPTEPADDKTNEALAAGAYLSLEDYEKQVTERADTAVVLFFHADWCPSCRATDESLTTAGVPAGLTVVKIDYDTATDLKREYGVTQQHTFIQVDRAGSQLAKWTGSVTGEDIKAQATQG